MNVVEIITGTLRSLVCDALNRLITATSAPLEQRTNVGAVAASAVVTTDALDLGPKETRQHTRVIGVKIGLVSAGESLQLNWSDDLITWYLQMPSALGSATNTTTVNSTSLAVMNCQGIPPGRYVRMRYANGSADQTDLILTLTAIAGI